MVLTLAKKENQYAHIKPFIKENLTFKESFKVKASLCHKLTLHKTLLCKRAYKSQIKSPEVWLNHCYLLTQRTKGGFLNASVLTPLFILVLNQLIVL